jgi:flagellar motor component MotA
MTRLLCELHRIEDASKRTITEGVVKYAMGFYLIMRKHKVEDYKEVIEQISKYFQLMDEKYYSELEGRPDDMQELTDFLNDQPASLGTSLHSARPASLCAPR